MNEKYLTIREVSRLIRVTPLTLRNWDKKGLLAAYRNPLNNYRLYKYSDVANLLIEIEGKGKNKNPILKLKVVAEE